MYLMPFKEAFEILQQKFSTPRIAAGVLILLALYTFAFIYSQHFDKKPYPLSLHTEELTWNEIQELVEQGYESIIIPTGGIEQKGHHLVTGKHGSIVRHTSEKIAQNVEHTLVAPVINFVPEAPHMDFPGTISVPDKLFEDLLTQVILSYQQHGFKNFFLIGDSGGNQLPQNQVSTFFKNEYPEINVWQIDDYYSGNRQKDWLLEQGFTQQQIGNHAGIRDTAEMLSINRNHVRPNSFSERGFTPGQSGNFTLADADIGKKMLELKINAATQQIKQLISTPEIHSP